MKLKRIIAASMAGVMAVSSAIVCQISVSAAETDITYKITDTDGISVEELSQYKTLKVTYEPQSAVGCGDLHDSGVQYCTEAKVAFFASSVDGMASDISATKKSTWYAPDDTFFAVTNKDEAETTAEVSVADIIASFSNDTDWQDTFTLKSITVQCWKGTLVSVTGVSDAADTRTNAQFPDYDDAPITMTKQAATSWCPNGTAQGIIPVFIDGITIGTTTYGEIKEKYKNFAFNGIKYVKDTVSGSASDYTYCFNTQWGSGWTSKTSSDVSLESEFEWSIDGLADGNNPIYDNDTLQYIGIQINMKDVNNLPANVAALQTDETFTINPASAPVESITITDSDGNAVADRYTYGETINLKAEITPADDQEVTWTSETPSVATVDKNGVVTPHKADIATITATAGGKSASVTFVVDKQKLTVVPSVLNTLYITDNDAETAAKKEIGSYRIDPLEKMGLAKGVDYIVSAPQISADKKSYSITLTLSDEADSKYVLSTTTLKGELVYVLSSVALNYDTLTIAAGGEGRQLTATTTPDNALLDNLKFSYSSDDPAVASVDENGNITPLKAGSATIEVTAFADVMANGKVISNKKASAMCMVIVTDKAIPATKIELDADNKTMKVGEKSKLTATVSPADTSDKVTWKSSNEKVAAVDENGNVTALSAGTAEITATAGSVSAVCKVTVKAPQTIPDNVKYPAIPKDFTKIDPVVTNFNSDGTKDMLLLYSVSDEDIKYDELMITFRKADGKQFERKLFIDTFYTSVTYTKDGDIYIANSQKYIAIRLRNVQNSWGDISIMVEPINPVG